jgi:hypothetical protein
MMSIDSVSRKGCLASMEFNRTTIEGHIMSKFDLGKHIAEGNVEGIVGDEAGKVFKVIPNSLRRIPVERIGNISWIFAMSDNRNSVK